MLMKAIFSVIPGDVLLSSTYKVLSMHNSGVTRMLIVCPSSQQRTNNISVLSFTMTLILMDTKVSTSSCDLQRAGQLHKQEDLQTH